MNRILYSLGERLYLLLFRYMCRTGLILRCQDAPDTTQINQAAADQVALSKEALAWYQNEYARTQPQRDAAAALATKVSEAQLRGMETATRQAEELDARNKAVFRPMEDRIVADANNFDTEAKREELAGQAITDVNTAFDSARGQSARSLARVGVAPGSGRALSMENQVTTAQALAGAGAATKARRDASAEGYARRMDAVGLGKGIVGNQVTMQQVAQNGGAQAVAAAGSGVNVAQSGAGLMGQGFGTAQNGLSAGGNLYGMSAKLNAEDSGLMGALGNVAGQFAGSKAGSSLIAGWFSDESVKTGTDKPLDTAEALKGIEATPVKTGWRYSPEKGGPDDGGRRHDGPMAAKVKAHMGSNVSDGKTIDIVSMTAHILGGMQELSKRVGKVERKVKS